MKSPASVEKTAASGRIPLTAKGRSRVDLLMRSARDLFAASGYDGTTMTAIASEAGASIGSLYQYFPTKHHIVREIEKDGLSDVLACLERAGRSDQPPCEVALAAFDALIDHSDRDPAFRVVCERRDLDPVERKRLKDTIAARIADRLRRAEPPLSPSRAMVSAILVLHLSEAANAPGSNGIPASEALKRSEIRRMLGLYLADPG